MPSRFVPSALSGMTTAPHVVDANAVDLERGEPHRRDRDHAVRRRGAAGIVARTGKDTELVGVALAQRDQRRAGVDHEVEPAAIDRALDLEVAEAIAAHRHGA